MKKLMIVVLLALFASACGGSSDGDNAADVVDATDSTDETEEEADLGELDEPDLPEPLEVEPVVQTRDCAHTAAELGGDDEEAAEDVPLPPQEKPVVDAEYLVAVEELLTTDLIDGTGEEAGIGSAVEMQYVGVLADGGSQFDASWDRGAETFSFTLGGGQVIAGWDEGIAGMKVGGRRVLQIPSDKAYGDTARGEDIPANSDLVFIVDLVGIGAGAEPAPPIDDSNLGSFDELTIVDLVEGEGCTAEYGDAVKVNYVGVDAVDGIEFDSSWGRGEPFEILVGRSQVIDGWNAGIEGMKVGGERILQIPSADAYGEGDLVFRIHLEELAEAPLAHTLRFEGDPPADAEITTLVEGSGDGVTSADVLDLNIAVMLWNDGVIIQSTWQQNQPTQLALSGGALIDGLAESIVGTKVGETRQIVLPTSVAYPDGVPEGAGFEPGDALVFVIEPLRITAG